MYSTPDSYSIDVSHLSQFQFSLSAVTLVAGSLKVFLEGSGVLNR